MRIETPQRLHVGKLEEGPVADIGGTKRPRTRAEERSLQRGERILILGYGIEGGNNWDPCAISPSTIVIMQRLTIGIADESGTIVDFRRPRGSSLEVLHLSQVGEPAAKGLLVLIVFEPEEIGRTVSRTVFIGGEHRQFSRCSAMTR